MDTQEKRDYTEKEVREAISKLILTDSTGTVRDAIAQTIFDSFATDGITFDPDSRIGIKACADADVCLEKIRAPGGDTHITYTISCEHSFLQIYVSFQNVGDLSMIINLCGGIDEDGEVYVNESHISSVSD